MLAVARRGCSEAGEAGYRRARAAHLGGQSVRVAAFQAPLLPAASMDAIGLICARVSQCEAEGIEVLCCPEAILGGLADYCESPTSLNFHAQS